MLIFVEYVTSWTRALLALSLVKRAFAIYPPFFVPVVQDLRPGVILGVNVNTARDGILKDNVRAPTLFSLRSIAANATTDKAADVLAEQIELPLNHSDKSAGMFNNSYWVSTKYYKPGGPVFLFDAGEGNGADLVPLFTYGAPDIYTDFLREFHGLGIIWEHRYYGNSLPPNHSSTSPESFRYLTISEALADIQYFASRFHRKEFPDQDLTPAGTPWVMIGASYAGMRAAFAREKYPETIYAAYVSSAPVQAMIDFSSYYDQIYRAMVAAGREGCARDLHAAMGWIDEQLAHRDTSADVKRMFLGKEADVNDNSDFASSLAAIYSRFQYTGVGDADSDLDSLCKWMEIPPDSLLRKNEDRTQKKKMAVTNLSKPYSADQVSSESSVDQSVTSNEKSHSMSNDRRDLIFDTPWIPFLKPMSNALDLRLFRPAKRSAVDSSLSTPTATDAKTSALISTSRNTKATTTEITTKVPESTTTSTELSRTKANSQPTTNSLSPTSMTSSETKARLKETTTTFTTTSKKLSRTITGSSNATPKSRAETNTRIMTSTSTTTITHTAPSAGWAPTIGRRAVAERFASWPQLTSIVNSFTEMSCNNTVNSDMTSCNSLKRPLLSSNHMSWTWQYCSEWGFFQNNNDGPHALSSRYNTVQYHQKECYRAFPGDFLPRSPQVNRTNEETGGWTIRPSNTFWTTSEFDPWRPLSLLSAEDFGPKVTVTQEIPLCNEGPSDKVFGYILEGEVHGADLASDSEDARAARLLFRKALKVWLSCWSKRPK